MPREGAEAKGRRYITEGRLLVHHIGRREIQATCRGNGEVYRVGYRPGGWYCDCPALGRCCHLIGLQLVAVVPGSVGGR